MSCSCALDRVCRLRPKLLRGSSDLPKGAALFCCCSGYLGALAGHDTVLAQCDAHQTVWDQ